MLITFTDRSGLENASIEARIVNSGDFPGDLDRTVTEGAKAARFGGKAGQTYDTFIDRSGKVVRLALVGTGEAGASDRQAALEKAGGALAAKYLASGEKSLALDLGNSGLSAAETVSFLLGLRLRSWRFDVYRTKLKAEQKVSLEKALIVDAPAGTEELWDSELAVAKGVEFTRELVTEPGNIIYPESFVERCRDRFKDLGAEIGVLTETEMEALGMGALLGVSQGSARKPRMLAIRWNGGAEGDAPTVFVGKGVTFDSGGISIKPGAGMQDMKWDMGGAGAVAGAMLAIAGRKAKANVIGVCGLVENMPDGNAQRPGDVVTTMSGQTVEIINTDAEGRLVLGDALTWAQREFKPARIVDLATLTGAMLVALGHEQAGMFSNNDELAGQLDAAGKSSGDKLWRMPLSPEYDRLMDSVIADMKNAGPRVAGSITAGQYLQRFIENDTPWAHLDIAGMAWIDKDGPTWNKGATGFGVRLLDQFIRDIAEG
ncbi:leucyl aminopeptidase [Altericroceibacterium endophyticum]|uniref:Probable cytosol aminopeptidase n=1 Tax=Altericroceibacterium endophyticum TaxID=1808508 RepID=A0A6I4T927_9SPHN|nr:leucyl aminopeptidase [Altericroceibacterium endophyticum]MXO66782.1 leucyl aminopeptidase [Altericroceibacterium endophyticum]